MRTLGKGVSRVESRADGKRKSRPKQPLSFRGAKRRGNPFSLKQQCFLHGVKETRIATASLRTGLAMTGRFTWGAVQGRAGRPGGRPLRMRNKVCGKTGRCGERTERCRWQRKRSERVAAVKILSVCRKAAPKFWAPQQGHPHPPSLLAPLPKEGWHGEAVTGGFFSRTSCNPSVGATLAVARGRGNRRSAASGG